MTQQAAPNQTSLPEGHSITTKGGSPVRIYAGAGQTGPDGKIHGAYQNIHDENWHVCSWQSNGCYHSYDSTASYQRECALDLMVTDPQPTE